MIEDKLAVLGVALEKAAKLLLVDWRSCGKPDDVILRGKLAESGWKYRRACGGGWYHPLSPEVDPPHSLRRLADLIVKLEATRILKEKGV